ncbi:MAG: hypothetical protein Q8M31_23780 [Beijerinckiaceae bacterium]|nr:hypothetical protein [Beijerinckiaceae bacterium]
MASPYGLLNTWDDEEEQRRRFSGGLLAQGGSISSPPAGLLAMPHFAGAEASWQPSISNPADAFSPSRMPLSQPRQQSESNPPVAQASAADLAASRAAESGPASMPGAPMQLPGGQPAAPMQQQQQKPEGGFLDGLLSKIGSIYGQGGPGDGLINMGLAVASPGNLPQNLQRAMQMHNATQLARAKQAQEQLKFGQQQAGQASSAKLLSQRLGISEEDAMGIVRSGAGDNVIADQFRQREPKTPQLVQRQRPDGTTESVWLTPGQTEGPVAAVGPREAPKVQTVKLADQSEVSRQWDPASGRFIPLQTDGDGTPGASPKLSEAQSKDLYFYNNGASLIPRLEAQENDLVNGVDALKAGVPYAGNYFTSDAYRAARQTGRELLAVILRKSSGAAVTVPEEQQYSQIYLPQPGDDAATIQQKRLGRKNAIEGIRMGLGSAEIIIKQQEALRRGAGGGSAASPDLKSKYGLE